MYQKKLNQCYLLLKQSQLHQQSAKVAQEAREQSKNTTNAMLKLDQESEKIGETMNIITQIAFQTNILS